ncbi:Phosphoribosyl transferase domain protein [Rickettsiales bacterium Ac37b]|nr:Phosphoribosyl transferase domain protein [Rickettsiales bacterium Ac37b]
MFKDRCDAGKKLASLLSKYRNASNTIVLALPRGGVPIAYEIAKELVLPLNICLVRKLGVPSYPELAMGAIALSDTIFLDKTLIKQFNLTMQDVQKVIDQEIKELIKRDKLYRNNKPYPVLEAKEVIIIDDGFATGATALAAISYIKKHGAQKIIFAVPVGPSDIEAILEPYVDEIACLCKLTDFYAVGQAYQDFSQVLDEEVLSLLRMSD